MGATCGCGEEGETRKDQFKRLGTQEGSPAAPFTPRRQPTAGEADLADPRGCSCSSAEPLSLVKEESYRTAAGAVLGILDGPMEQSGIFLFEQHKWRPTSQALQPAMQDLLDALHVQLTAECKLVAEPVLTVRLLLETTVASYIAIMFSMVGTTRVNKQLTASEQPLEYPPFTQYGSREWLGGLKQDIELIRGFFGYWNGEMAYGDAYEAAQHLEATLSVLELLANFLDGAPHTLPEHTQQLAANCSDFGLAQLHFLLLHRGLDDECQQMCNAAFDSTRAHSTAASSQPTKHNPLNLRLFSLGDYPALPSLAAIVGSATFKVGGKQMLTEGGQRVGQAINDSIAKAAQKTGLQKDKSFCCT